MRFLQFTLSVLMVLPTNIDLAFYNIFQIKIIRCIYNKSLFTLWGTIVLFSELIPVFCLQ